ncbi:MAG TPA: hypothetical protein VGB37_16435 [Candidatus Lokiarchaeia archaeon]
MQKKENKMSKDNYIFGDVWGNLMAKTTPAFQMESAMMSLLFLMIGVLLTGVYIVFWTDFATFFKVLTAINSFFGVIFLNSQLIALFQAYQGMKSVQNISQYLKGGSE